MTHSKSAFVQHEEDNSIFSQTGRSIFESWKKKLTNSSKEKKRAADTVEKMGGSFNTYEKFYSTERSSAVPNNKQ